MPLIVEVPLAQAPLTSGMYQRVTAGFAAAGWPEESIIASMSILETFIFGAAVDSPGVASAAAVRVWHRGLWARFLAACR
ncbi:TetR family transcriptional regulator [Mycobacteroides abscessus subsp. abscessus]|nr:TetR family transcriptional regulator [Mycobacteroides abscessus subsp. abscessus]